MLKIRDDYLDSNAWFIFVHDKTFKGLDCIHGQHNVRCLPVENPSSSEERGFRLTSHVRFATNGHPWYRKIVNSVWESVHHFDPFPASPNLDAPWDMDSTNKCFGDAVAEIKSATLKSRSRGICDLDAYFGLFNNQKFHDWLSQPNFSCLQLVTSVGLFGPNTELLDPSTKPRDASKKLLDSIMQKVTSIGIGFKVLALDAKKIQSNLDRLDKFSRNGNVVLGPILLRVFQFLLDNLRNSSDEEFKSLRQKLIHDVILHAMKSNLYEHSHLITNLKDAFMSSIGYLGSALFKVIEKVLDDAQALCFRDLRFMLIITNINHLSKQAEVGRLLHSLRLFCYWAANRHCMFKILFIGDDKDGQQKYMSGLLADVARLDKRDVDGKSRRLQIRIFNIFRLMLTKTRRVLAISRSQYPPS
jgi:hypothetical protein